MTYALFAVGLLLLVAGAEALVRGASRLAAAVGITPLVIGLTVVAFGTSAPELTVSVLAAIEGGAGSDIAVGNVVGSNIFNVLFILGLSAVITPLAVADKLVRIDVPLMIAISVGVLLLGLDGTIARLEGVLLFAGIVAYALLALRQGRREGRISEAVEAAAPVQAPTRRSMAAELAYVVAGLLLLAIGSRWLVSGAIAMASALGVSELVVSLTIVAAGTSLPEVATSVLASIRGARDIAVGNVVGSNIFNLLGVLGLSSAVAPEGVSMSPAALSFDVPVMIASAVACLPIFVTGLRIHRLEGVLFLAYYAAYVAYLVLAGSRHDALHIFSSVMLFVVIPSTALVLLLSVAQELRRRARRVRP